MRVKSRDMYIKTFYCNPFRECTYIVTHAEDTQAQDCLIVDPGMYGEGEDRRVLDYLAKHSLTPVAILITHKHPDHICGRETIEQHFGALPVYGFEYNCPAEDEPVTLAGMTFRMLHTPGHKEDSICFYFEADKIMFTGDTIFQESIGRTDLPGGDMDTLMDTLQRLIRLPEDTQLYPGHGYPTTIAHERQYNPYI